MRVGESKWVAIRRHWAFDSLHLPLGGSSEAKFTRFKSKFGNSVLGDLLEGLIVELMVKMHAVRGEGFTGMDRG